MIDCVASLHTNTWTCGVARFNAQLAQRLGVPLVSLPMRLGEQEYQHPLLSLKMAEMSAWMVYQLDGWAFAHHGQFDLFLHDATHAGADLAYHARNLYGGNATIKGATALWCPSTIPIADLSHMTRIITFGMGHKLALPSYQKLRTLLDGQPFALGVSMAMHEGQEWDTNMAALEANLRPLFGSKLHMFGYLADAALSSTLQSATACAMFFEGGVRANNTTFWAALEHGCPVITNLDEWSPPELLHPFNVFDIDRLGAWPAIPELLVAAHNGKLVAHRYSWDRLVEAIQR